MSTQVITKEPMCCGTPMVHNTFRGGYECAEAFFYLEDEGIVGDCGELRDWVRRLSDFDRERHAHWRRSFLSDICWAATLFLAGLAL